MRWVVLYCAVLLVYSKTEIELNIEENIDNCFAETFGLSESSWNEVNAQESFVTRLKDCLKTKNMLQISEKVMENITQVAGNLTRQANQVHESIASYSRFVELFYTQIMNDMRTFQSHILSASSFFSNLFYSSANNNIEQKIEEYATYVRDVADFCTRTREKNIILFDKIHTYVNANLPYYTELLIEYNNQRDQFKSMTLKKQQIQQLIVDDALLHVNYRLSRQRFDANCIPNQPWLQCTNDFQHVDECYRPARIYSNGVMFAVNSSIEIAEPSFCLNNQLCVYTPRGFRCTDTGSTTPNVVHHTSSGFGRSYDVLHRYGTYDVSFFTLNKLKQRSIQDMLVEELGIINHNAFNQYIFEMYDQLE